MVKRNIFGLLLICALFAGAASRRRLYVVGLQEQDCYSVLFESSSSDTVIWKERTRRTQGIPSKSIFRELTQLPSNRYILKRVSATGPTKEIPAHRREEILDSGVVVPISQDTVALKSSLDELKLNETEQTENFTAYLDSINYQLEIWREIIEMTQKLPSTATYRELILRASHEDTVLRFLLKRISVTSDAAGNLSKKDVAILDSGWVEMKNDSVMLRSLCK